MHSAPSQLPSCGRAGPRDPVQHTHGCNLELVHGGPQMNPQSTHQPAWRGDAALSVQELAMKNPHMAIHELNRIIEETKEVQSLICDAAAATAVHTPSPHLISRRPSSQPPVPVQADVVEGRSPRSASRPRRMNHVNVEPSFNTDLAAAAWNANWPHGVMRPRLGGDAAHLQSMLHHSRCAAAVGQRPGPGGADPSACAADHVPHHHSPGVLGAVVGPRAAPSPLLSSAHDFRGGFNKSSGPVRASIKECPLQHFDSELHVPGGVHLRPEGTPVTAPSSQASDGQNLQCRISEEARLKEAVVEKVRSELQSVQDEHRKEITGVRDEMQRLARASTSLPDKVAAWESEMQQVRSCIGVAQATTAQISTSQQASLMDRVATVEKALAGIASTLQTADTAGDSRHAMVAQRLSCLETSVTSATKHGEAVGSVKSQIEDVRTQLKQHLSQVERLEQRVQRHMEGADDNRINVALLQFDVVRSRVDATGDHVKQCGVKLESLESAVSAINAKLENDWTDRHGKVKAVLSEHTARLEQLEQSIAGSNVRHEELERSCISLCETLQEHVAQANGQSEQHSSEISALKAEQLHIDGKFASLLDLHACMSKVDQLVERQASLTSEGGEGLERFGVLEGSLNEALDRLRSLELSNIESGNLQDKCNDLHHGLGRLTQKLGQEVDAMRAEITSAVEGHVGRFASVGERLCTLERSLKSAAQNECEDELWPSSSLIDRVAALERSVGQRCGSIDGHRNASSTIADRLDVLERTVGSTVGQHAVMEKDVWSIKQWLDREGKLAVHLESNLTSALRERDMAKEAVEKLRQSEVEQQEAVRALRQENNMKQMALEEEQDRNRAFELALEQAKAEISLAQSQAHRRSHDDLSSMSLLNLRPPRMPTAAASAAPRESSHREPLVKSMDPSQLNGAMVDEFSLPLNFVDLTADKAS